MRRIELANLDNARDFSRELLRIDELIGRRATIELLDDMNRLGFREATRSGLSFGTDDLITPENNTGLHLKLLARISRILKNDPFKSRLLGAADGDEILGIIKEEDEEF